ncbi:hypothetical protein NE619_13255 [Anaerovorax odorimutans]|uniref:Uncharacterized protein n=1 Tax=Anaerovorax odorimutans TaxID=109327 RepID=A0ABT1RR68_9FIRM|nr:hypothetical protein [Anaerovorax odorimutans]MCQ4637695.1 hypothetical protein [Anaerovorax odorimutans]
MINLEVILTVDPAKLALMMCYLCHDCQTCPVCGLHGPDVSAENCRRKLYGWIMGPKDEKFWRYIEDE